MMGKNIKVWVIFFSLLLVGEIPAQTSLNGIENEIKSELVTKYGEVYSVGVIENVNEDIRKYRFPKFQITDPYSTLKDCYIFPAYVRDGGLLGIYKNGTIIWDSGPIIAPGVNQDVYGVEDLNNDGSVEILASFYYGMRNPIQTIWIFSWDGQSGSLLNETKTYGVLNESVIFSFEWFTDIFDIDGDGILEIKGQDEETREIKIYNWNGKKYGDFGVQMPQFIPMNLITAKVSCIVEKSQYGLLYNYAIVNDSLSKQSIWLFAVDKTFEDSFRNSGPPNNKWIERYPESLIQWDVNTDLEKYPFDVLYPGASRSNFKLETNVPVISLGNYYVQGVNGRIQHNENDLLENSFKGVTICGKNPVNPFIPEDFLDTLLNYDNQALKLGWIKDSLTANKYAIYFNTAKAQLQQKNTAGSTTTLNKVLQDVIEDSSSNLTSEAYALIKYNTEYLVAHLPIANPFPLIVQFKNSMDSLLTGGALQYYEGGWKDAVNNGDGTFGINTDKSNISLKMNYEHGSQTVSNIPAQNNTYVFNTVNVNVQLKNSQGALVDSGKVQYYAGGWRSFGITSGGIATKELLPNSYSFRMHYSYGSYDKKQNIGIDSVVIFKTVKANVQLQNSRGDLIDAGTVQYYSGGWRDFGITTNGVSTKELLPNNYSFRMHYAYGSNDKKQNIGNDSIVIFKTVSANVQLQNSHGDLLDAGTVQYYAGGWRDFGITINGVSTKELLPNNYSFRMHYANGSNDKKQNIGIDSVVVFKTVNANVQLRNSQGNLIDQGTVQYYASGWRAFGTTTNGNARKELLPNTYSFRMHYAYGSNDKKQNIGSDPIVVFKTVNANVQLRNSQGNFIDQGTVQYYAGGWRSLGTTSDGVTSKELLPGNYSFRMIYDYVSNDKKQDIAANNTVVFSTVLCTINVTNSQNQPVDGADIKYYSGDWRDIGQTVSGRITKELLPKNLTFRMIYNSVREDKTRDISDNSVVNFNTGEQ